MSDNRLNIRPIESRSIEETYRFSHDGYSGGANIRGFNIGSTSSSHVYTNIKASIIKIGDVDLSAADFFTSNGWSIKLITQKIENYPTEEEWNETLPNTEVMLEDIGIKDSEGVLAEADTDTLQYLFVRVFCPGHTDPGQYNHEISLTYNSINLR